MKTKIKKTNKNKLILIPLALLLSISSFLAGTKYENQIRDAIEDQPVVINNQVLEYPKESKVKRVIDGDTIELNNGIIVRYVGINVPNDNEKIDEQATDYNKKHIEGKKVKLEYDAYKSDRFGRILAYVIINDKNLAIELVKKGFAKVSLYEKRRPLIYQQELIKAQEEAKSKKIGIWSR